MTLVEGLNVILMEEKQSKSREGFCETTTRKLERGRRKKKIYKASKLLLVILTATLGFSFFFFPLSLLLTAILSEARLGCTDAYFGN